METMQALIPFTREMLAQGVGGRMVKVYLLGTAVAALGVALGVVETICQPFSAEESLDEELERPLRKGRRVRGATETRRQSNGEELEAEVLRVQAKKEPLAAAGGRRNSATRLHAS
ncbi:G0/G1 switch protein 2-like [Brienomyrus brachyistius]|uniref:G0/G1 switch protein 2-like n=1 Tax=Brienomyrus brachyistius TaxID=42636 RepID=UPI0020B3C0BF|nr:G0/G1 switch protein 2-like [Brienomyrus brachyistius]